MNSGFGWNGPEFPLWLCGDSPRLDING